VGSGRGVFGDNEHAREVERIEPNYVRWLGLDELVRVVISETGKSFINVYYGMYGVEAGECAEFHEYC
jgi:hypothetical protein